MTEYSALKVADLKGILKERGIPSTGLSRKQQIVDALQAHDAENSEGKPDPADEHVRDEEDEEVKAEAGVEDAPEQVQNGEQDIEAGEGEEAAVEVEQELVKEENRLSSEPPSAPKEPTPPPSDSEPTQQSDAPMTEATILEHNEPLSKEPSALATPQRTSPGVESQSSESRKRKRRSLTPAPSQDTLNKKLRAVGVDVDVKLPEDHDKVMEDAPVAVDGSAETVMPNSNSDDTMDVTKADSGVMEDMKAESTLRSPSKGDIKVESSDPMDVSAPPAEDDEGPPTSPAIHPATRALYIRDLLRPLQRDQLRDHLVQIATPPASAPANSIVETLHLDALRTHAFVTFSSISAASRARSALHARIWPDEPVRKRLWVDFVPEEKVGEWTDRELNAGTGRRDARKWEVVYSLDESGEMGARLEEVAGSAPGVQRQASSFSGDERGQGMPNAPLGPRGSRPSVQQPQQQQQQQQQQPARPERRSSHQHSPPGQKATPTPAPPPSASFTILDERFPSTTTKPKLYYLPVPKELVEKRLENLEKLSSKAWQENSGKLMKDGDQRRYTFEDGDRVVDGGADIGSFGRGGGGFGGGGGGYRGGRGRGGGYRGRR